jgi:hypothetical protein
VVLFDNAVELLLWEGGDWRVGVDYYHRRFFNSQLFIFIVIDCHQFHLSSLVILDDLIVFHHDIYEDILQ